MSKYDNSFVIQLIDAVKERPYLYDPGHEEYCNKILKMKAWATISDDLGCDSDQVKEKWKNLRDTFIKYYKCQHIKRFGNKNKKLHNWVWADHLSFLDVVCDRAQDPLAASSEKRKRKKDIYTTVHTQQSKTNCDETVNVNNSNKELMNFLKTNVISSNSNQTKQELDKTDYLFLGYAETFKNLTRRKQAELKLQLAKIFAEAELSYLDEVESQRISPLPSNEDVKHITFSIDELSSEN